MLKGIRTAFYAALVIALAPAAGGTGWAKNQTAFPYQYKTKKHMDVWLKNETGRRITPGHNDSDPYSPRETCGGCHPYSAITSGYHFDLGQSEMSDSYDLRRPWITSPGMYGKW